VALERHGSAGGTRRRHPAAAPGGGTGVQRAAVDRLAL